MFSKNIYFTSHLDSFYYDFFIIYKISNIKPLFSLFKMIRLEFRPYRSKFSSYLELVMLCYFIFYS